MSEWIVVIVGMGGAFLGGFALGHDRAETNRILGRKRIPEPVAEVEAGGVIEGVTFYGNVRVGPGARVTNVTIKPRRTP